MVNGTWFYTRKILFFHGEIRDGEFLSHKIYGTGRFTHIWLMFLISVRRYIYRYMDGIWYNSLRIVVDEIQLSHSRLADGSIDPNKKPFLSSSPDNFMELGSSYHSLS